MHSTRVGHFCCCFNEKSANFPIGLKKEKSYIFDNYISRTASLTLTGINPPPFTEIKSIFFYGTVYKGISAFKILTNAFALQNLFWIISATSCSYTYSWKIYRKK